MKNGRSKVVFCFGMLCIFLLSSVLFAQDASGNSRLSGEVVILEKIRDDAVSDIVRYEKLISDCEATARRSEAIITLAVQKGNVKAEQIAREALSNAQEAMRKNEANKSLAEARKAQAEKAIASARNLPGQQGLKPMVMGGSPLTADEMERQAFIKKHGPNYIDQVNMFGLRDIPDDGVIKDEESGRSWGEAGLRTAMGQIPGLEGHIANFEMNVSDASLKNLNQAVGCLVNGDDAGAEKLGKDLLGGKAVKEATQKTAADIVTNYITDKATDKMKDGLYGGAKQRYYKNEVARLVEQEKWGIAQLKALQENAKLGATVADDVYKGSKILIDLWDNKKGEK